MNIYVNKHMYKVDDVKRFLAIDDVDKMNEHDKDILRMFKLDIYKAYVMIRNVHKPRACEKLSLEKLKSNLRDHWLETYCKMTRQEAEFIIYCAECFYGVAIK